jgi:hypothetical protein
MAIQDSDLRVAVRRFIEEQNKASEKFSDDLATAREKLHEKALGLDGALDEAFECQMQFLKNILHEGKKLIEALGTDISSTGPEQEAKPASDVSTDPPADDSEPLPALDPFETTLVTMYNEEPDQLMRKFRPKEFGAENVNEIWDTGGEPRFARKENGIYNLLEENGCYYVVPEPGLRLKARYFKSEGVSYLFDVGGTSVEDEPLIRLIKPAKVSESGGRWIVQDKGLIGRRH